MFTVCVTARDESTLNVATPETHRDKVLVKMEMENRFTNAVQSARAEVFVPEGKHKVVGRSSRLVTGGILRKPGRPSPPLAPIWNERFNFIVGPLKPLTSTNLAAKVTFSQTILQGGKLASPSKSMQTTSKGE